MVSLWVVLKAWLKKELPTPYQVQEVEDLLVKHKSSVEKSIKLQRTSATETETTSNNLRATAAGKIGKQWLRVLDDRGGCC